MTLLLFARQSSTSASLQALTWACQIYPPWKSIGPPAAYGTSLMWLPVGSQGSQLCTIPKRNIAHSQSSHNAHCDSLLHLGRRMIVATALLPLHITVGSAPQLPRKACAAIWRNASSIGQEGTSPWGMRAVWYPAERQLHQAYTE